MFQSSAGWLFRVLQVGYPWIGVESSKNEVLHQVDDELKQCLLTVECPFMCRAELSSHVSSM